MGNLLQYGNSVTLYAACFLLSAALAGLAQLYERRTRPIRLSPNGWQGTRPALVLWALSLAVPLLLSSLRWEVGTDYVTYGQLYTSLNQIDTLGEFVYQLPITEPGYILLNFFVKAVFNTPVMVYAICALITLFFFYRAIEDYHEKGSVMLAALVFFALFYSVTLNIMRQMIAVSIMFFATRYLFRQKYSMAAAWAVVAASFHVTALVVVVFWSSATAGKNSPDGGLFRSHRVFIRLLWPSVQSSNASPSSAPSACSPSRRLASACSC